ncbi:hypothetical protein FB451DRAFT_1415791 [Mycena latifolia]|nr:hypothetical protein FB451DRAFT_1415791 [Mycena latifolia]
MSGLLLAPYNDSMRLGQGFDSFLQPPCVYNAVKVKSSSEFAKKITGAEVAQVVSYSSRFVDRIFDVTRFMNISAGSSVKNGSVSMSGNTLSVWQTGNDYLCGGWFSSPSSRMPAAHMGHSHSVRQQSLVPEWAAPKKIISRDFTNVQLYASDLLDTNLDPSLLKGVEEEAAIESPEVWATRLPVPPPVPALPAPIATPTSPSEVMAPPPPPDLTASPEFTGDEQAFVSSLENRRRYKAYWFDKAAGNLTRILNYNDVVALEESTIWPTKFEVKHVVTRYKQMLLSHGSERGNVVTVLDVDLPPGEAINRVKMRGRANASAAVSFVEYEPPTGFTGLKGLFGSDGDAVDRIGVIWG